MLCRLWCGRGSTPLQSTIEDGQCEFCTCRSVHSIEPDQREHLSVLSYINANGGSIPNFYILKGRTSWKTISHVVRMVL